MKRPKQVPSFVTAYSYEPLPDEPGTDLGSLYVVMEVLVSGRASEEVADLIIETIGDHYYNQPLSNAEPLSRFEAAIKAANNALAEHVNHGNAAWIGKLSAVVAMQVGADLHVTQTGSAEAFLYRGKAVTHISSTGVNRPSTPTKTFGSIASGQLETGDRLLLATPALIHQVPLTRLQSIISQSGPNNAISEITELLRGTSTERIAALVIELTTPELAALQVRSEQPNEIQLGLPETPLEAAKLAAAPIAHTTLASGKKVATVAHTGWKRAKPHAKALSLALAEKLRQLLSTTLGRRLSAVAVVVVILSIAGAIWYNNSTAHTAKVFSNYQGVYQEFRQAQAMLDGGSKSEARAALEATRQKLKALKPQENLINKQLSHATLLEAQPPTLEGLIMLIDDRLDQIDGLVKADPTTITTLTAKNARPEHFEIINDKAYIFDAGNANALSIVSTLSGSIAASSVATTKLGKIISTTLSVNKDGIYILTDKPSVWFYRLDNDSLAEQSIAFGSWPKASSLAAYGSNLYLLGDSTIYRHTKNATGFSPKVEYLPAGSPELKAATGLAVDGSVYVASATGLHTYLAGALKQSSPIPSSLGAIENLRSINNGTVIVGTSHAAKRIGLWTASGTSLNFSRQVALSNVGTVYDTVYDTKSSNLYAVVDNRLVRFAIKL